jgi:hypothetical protein
MSFEAYLRNIEARTGKTPEELRAMAIEAGVFTPTMKASELVRLAQAGVQFGPRSLHGSLGGI